MKALDLDIEQFWKDEELDDTGVPDWAIKLFLTPEGMETVERRGSTH